MLAVLTAPVSPDYNDTGGSKVFVFDNSVIVSSATVLFYR